MKKLMILIAMFAIAGTVSAGLVSDPGFDSGITYVTNLNAGAVANNLDTGYDIGEYNAADGWVHAGNVTDLGGYVSINNASGARAVGAVIHDQAATTGSMSFTVDLLDIAGDVQSGTSITMFAYGMGAGWSTKTWDDYLAFAYVAPAKLIDAGGAVLLSQTITLSEITGAWDTFTADIDLGVGYEYVAVYLVANGIGGSGVGVDNLDIVAVPEPATVGMLGLGALVALLIRRVRR